MNQRFTISLSIILIATFMLFNVGLPVVNYLCPMMSAENPSCGMMPASGNQESAITNIIPACCSSYIVAERNTTPFLKIQEASAHVEAMTLAPASISPNPILPLQHLLSASKEAPSPPAPLFILHSSFLI